MEVARRTFVTPPRPLALFLLLLLGGALGAACSTGSDATAGDGGTSTEGASCHSSSECKSGFEQCLGPGAFGGCGAAASGDCDTDEDCKSVVRPEPVIDSGNDAAEAGDAGEVEAGLPPVRRVCAPPGPCQQRGSCVAPCTSDRDCPSTPPAAPQRCALATGKCELVQCSSDAECDVTSRCSDGPVRLCTRRACTTDADCNGACVNGFCSAGLGKCTPLPQ